MRNVLNDNDIKKSIIYYGNCKTIKTALIAGLSIIIFFGFLILVSYLDGEIISNLSILSIIIIATFICSAIPVITKYLENKYLIENYKDFYSYEVELNNFERTPMDKTRFIVQINVQGNTKTIRTNFCQSSNSLSKYHIDHLYQRKVLGLYDEKKDTFYIIRFAD